jgi:hypothetical protein
VTNINISSIHVQRNGTSKTPRFFDERDGRAKTLWSLFTIERRLRRLMFYPPKLGASLFAIFAFGDRESEDVIGGHRENPSTARSRVRNTKRNTIKDGRSVRTENPMNPIARKRPTKTLSLLLSIEGHFGKLAFYH